MLDEYYSKLKSKYFGYGKNLLLFGYVFFFLVLAMFLTYLILILFLVSFVGKKNCAWDEIDAAIPSTIKESAKLSMNKKVIDKLETSLLWRKGLVLIKVLKLRIYGKNMGLSAAALPISIWESKYSRDEHSIPEPNLYELQR